MSGRRRPAIFVRVKRTKAILEISNLRIERGGTMILDDVNWRVARGEHEVSLLGQVYGECDWRELRKRVGLVSSSVRQMMADEEPALETVASGKYAMIDFWGRVTRGEKAQAMKLLRQVECAHLAERPWGVLSQGERQRVLIGRALMARPRVLILDEPCAGLDPAAREHFLQFIQRLGAQKNSPALVLVTHHVEEIMPVFSHVLILKNGRVLAAAEKAEMLDSKNLSSAFGARMQLQRTGNRYALKVTMKARAMM